MGEFKNEQISFRSLKGENKTSKLYTVQVLVNIYIVNSYDKHPNDRQTETMHTGQSNTKI